MGRAATAAYQAIVAEMPPGCVTSRASGPRQANACGANEGMRSGRLASVNLGADEVERLLEPRNLDERVFVGRIGGAGGGSAAGHFSNEFRH